MIVIIFPWGMLNTENRTRESGELKLIIKTDWGFYVHCLYFSCIYILCVVVAAGKNGFGFILCCENETTDTFVLHVLKNSPASRASLIPGDRIIEVRSKCEC